MTSRQRRGMRHLVRKLKRDGYVTALDYFLAAHRMGGACPEMWRRMDKRGASPAMSVDAFVLAHRNLPVFLTVPPYLGQIKWGTGA